MGYQIHKIPDLQRDLDLYKHLYPEDSLANKRFYNIGAGKFSHPYWTNVDYDSDWYSANREQTLKGIHYDLFSLDRLPIDDASAEVVYTSHTVEHIPNRAAANMFSEAHRVLKPGGIFRATTPNIELEYRAYKDNDRHYYYWIDTYSVERKWKKAKFNKPLNQATIDQIFLSHFAGSVSTLHSDGAANRIDDAELSALFEKLGFEGALDYCASRCPEEIQKKYPGNHMNWWSFDKMSRMLKEAGFSKIYLSGYGQSACPVLRNTAYFDSTHPKISLYVEAMK